MEALADELLVKEGVRGYFDRVVFGTVSERGCALLTEDEELLKLKRSAKPRPSEVLTWRKILGS